MREWRHPTRARLAIAVAVLATAAAGTYAVRSAIAGGIPPANTLSYTGTLMTYGSPDNASHMMSAALYVSSVQQCASSTTSITCVDGQFTIPLPPLCETVVQTYATVQVQVTVDGVQMGYTNLGAVPYAVVAGNVAAGGVTGVLPIANGGTGSSTQNFVMVDALTGEAVLPAGTTAQRTSAPANGMIRYNDTTSALEAYVNGNWGTLNTATTCRAPGLLAELTFDEGSGTTSNDCTVHAHDLQLNSTGTTWVTGHEGTALQFDGSSGGATIVDGSDIGYGNFEYGMTVEMWVKWSGNAGSGSTPALFYSDASTTDEYWLSQTSASTTSVELNAAGPGCGANAPVLVAGSWVHIAGVWNKSASICTLFANGVQVASASWTASSVTAAAAPAFIGWSGGAGADTGLSYFSGAIDDVEFWAGARTPAQVCADAGQVWNGTSCS